MKELDVLLEQFLQRHSESLAAGKWPELEELLQTEDDSLWDWTRQPDQCPQPAWRPLLKSIREQS